MTCLQPLATPGVRACGARGEPSAVLPSRPREQLTRHDREDKVRALAAAAALVAWLGSAYPSALRAVCGHVCSSAPVYVRVERSGEACREAAIRLDQRWPDCACSSRVPPYRGADAVVGAERLWSVGGPSIPPCDHSASLRRGFSPRLGYTCLPAGESSGVLRSAIENGLVAYLDQRWQAHSGLARFLPPLGHHVWSARARSGRLPLLSHRSAPAGAVVAGSLPPLGLFLSFYIIVMDPMQVVYVMDPT